MMRKFLISAALLSVAAASAPAAAQYDSRYDDRRYDDRRGYEEFRGGERIDRQLAQISERIQRAYQRRLISSNEARRLEREVDQIDRLEDRYSRNGLSNWERQDLQRRVQHLRQRLQWERQEGRDDRRDDRRYDRW